MSTIHISPDLSRAVRPAARPVVWRLARVAPLLLAAGLLAAPVMAQGAGQGDPAAAAFARGDYDEARALWMALAETGDGEAMRELAQLYRLGLGVEESAEQAFRWYSEAAEKGIVDAQVSAALMLIRGEGVEKDAAAAVPLLKAAGDAGDALGLFNLGLLYENGIGVDKDLDAARDRYRAAAAQGHERSLARLDALESRRTPRQEANAAERLDQAREDAARAETERRQQAARPAPRPEPRPEPAVRRPATEAGSTPRRNPTPPRSMTITRIEGAAAEPAAPAASANNTPPAPVVSAAPAGDSAEPVTVEVVKPAPQPATAAARSLAPAMTPLPRPSPRIRVALPPAPAGTMAAPEQAAARPAPAPGLTIRREAGPAPALPETVVTQVAPPVAAPPSLEIRREPAPILFSAEPAPAPADLFDQARTAYARGLYTDAARQFSTAAQAGDVRSAFWLGRLFNRGEGVPLDRARAYRIWRSAALAGHAPAATALANLTERMTEAERSAARAN